MSQILTDIGDIVEKLLTPLGVPVYEANNNGPRLGKTYATIQVTTGTPQPVHKGRTNAEGIRTLSAHRTYAAQVVVYGEGAFGVADLVSLALFSETAQSLADKYNLSVFEGVRVQDVPALMSATDFEPRALLDFEGGYTLSMPEDVGYFDTVVGTGETTPGPGPLPFTASVRASQPNRSADYGKA